MYMNVIIILFTFLALLILVWLAVRIEDDLVQDAHHQAEKLVRANLGESIHIRSNKLRRDKPAWVLKVTYTNVSGQQQVREAIAIEDQHEANKFTLYWDQPVGDMVPLQPTPSYDQLAQEPGRTPSIYTDMSQLDDALAELEQHAGA
jgi:hypothetical protein